MKVLVIHSELGVLRGGGENFTRNLFCAFADRGHQVTAAFLADHKNRYPIPLPPQIKSIPIPGWWSRNAGQEFFSTIRVHLPGKDQFRIMWDRLQEAASWRVSRWHERRFQKRVEYDFASRWKEFDAVYVHHSAVLAAKVALLRPTILRLPGPVGDHLAPVLRNVHAVCANGDAFNCIRAFLGDHAMELPIGVDAARFRPGGATIRSRLGWKCEDRVVGYVGRLTHLKGVDLLALAFHDIARAFPDVKLLIVGSGAEEKFIRSTLDKEIAQRRVHIEVDVDHDELSPWYRAMDLLVMPSRYENFSNAMLEGMACGVPFVASDTGGNKMLSNTHAGWLFKTGTVNSLASQIISILKCPGESKRRGELGARHVHKSFSWAVSAQRLEQIFMSRLGVRG